MLKTPGQMLDSSNLTGTQSIILLQLIFRNFKSIFNLSMLLCINKHELTGDERNGRHPVSHLKGYHQNGCSQPDEGQVEITNSF